MRFLLETILEWLGIRGREAPLIPKRLEDWTLEAVKRLLVAAVQENESFDWKGGGGLPKSGPSGDADRELPKASLRKDCAAFANSGGGFLIFGVDDAKTGRTGEARLSGFDIAMDFNSEWGNFPSGCVPSVRWRPKTDPIRLPNGRVLHVVEIHAAGAGPHWVPISKGNLAFPKRTNKGTEDMTYEEVRLAFLGYHQRLAQMSLLRLELAAIDSDARRIAGLNARSQHPVTEVSVDVLERVLGDAYLVLSDAPDLLDGIREVRRKARELNAIQRQVMNVAIGKFSDGQKTFAEKASAVTASDLAMSTKDVIAKLDAFLASKGLNPAAKH